MYNRHRQMWFNLVTIKVTDDMCVSSSGDSKSANRLCVLHKYNETQLFLPFDLQSLSLKRDRRHATAIATDAVQDCEWNGPSHLCR